ncbi:PREDICTED: sorting nexin-2-like isoform X1 [Amphimedon queenslandica]|uniref:PX domain-containing protein n=3 Tax=Amphimedon queenslandica TaxID=400682 RepID=A0A1X7UV49_AMPQE|nr:PREDICTED: sorting nexin-2-like isoform X1 [Amphimedon queenslandica]|eukprot:XP_003386746.1 PREDICTED: sorting nexin-2-like isoform X1 [Amphimedon queenslandica]
MADEPPPLDVEASPPPDDNDELSEDNIFGKPSLDEPEPAKKEETKKEEDLFGEEEETEAPPASTERPHTDSEPPTLEPDDPEPPPPVVEVPPAAEKPVTTSAPSGGDLFDEEGEEEPKQKPVTQEAEAPASKEEEEEEEEEDVDQYELTITVAEPEKVGDGMGAYMTYLVTTKTTLPSFKEPEVFVRRRFSDFLGLYYRLSEKFMCMGYIVPPAPEKSVTGMTKIKFSKNEENSALFIQRRRANLERFLNRLAIHPVIRKDEDFKMFLENPGELPKAKDTSAMSGAGLMRLVKNVGDTFSKIAGKKGDVDSWFDDRQSEYETLDTHLKKLHSCIESMISARKELCGCTAGLVKNLAMLANVEENNSVSRALTRLSEVEEKVESLHSEQSNVDLYVFGETIRDYVALLGSLRETFNQRVKNYGVWTNAQKTLQSKRDSEAKMQTTGKTDKLPIVQAEIKDWEQKEKDAEKAFNKCSKVLKREVERFETVRTKEFKAKFLEHLEALMHMQEELIRLWEGYLPDVQAIEAES